MLVKLTFSKELKENPSSPSKRPNKQIRLYTIYYQNNQIAGHFFFRPTEQVFKIDDREIIVQRDSKLFRNEPYTLVNKTTQEQVGRFEIVGHGDVNRKNV